MNLRHVSRHRGQVVYVHWDRDLNALYVGMTGNMLTRSREHTCNSYWAGQVVAVSTMPCRDREDARRTEEAMIRLLQPRFNKIHNPGW